MDESNETEIIFEAQLSGSLILLGQMKENVSEPVSDESEGEQVEKQESVPSVETELLLFLKGVISEIKAFLVLSKGTTITKFLMGKIF